MNGAGRSDCSVPMSPCPTTVASSEINGTNIQISASPRSLRNRLNMCPEVRAVLTAQPSPLMVTQASVVFRSREDPKTIAYPNGNSPIRASVNGVFQLVGVYRHGTLVRGRAHYRVL